MTTNTTTDNTLGTIFLGLLMITAGAGAFVTGTAGTAEALPAPEGGCSYLAPPTDGCTPPPADMVAWYTLDEPESAIVVHDNIEDHHARLLGDPAQTPGKVAGGFTFDADGDEIRADHAQSLNPGTGDLSIDAWIRLDHRGGTVTVLEKMGLVPNVQPASPTTPLAVDEAVESQPEAAKVVGDASEQAGEALGPVAGLEIEGGIAVPVQIERGYDLFIQNGELKLTLKDGVNTGTWGAQMQVTIDAWHHVAVTVDRDDPQGGTFYLDGAAVRTFNPTPVSGTLNNLADLVAGTYASPVPTVTWEEDEIELFHRVLEHDEVHRLYEAQEAGKCKTDCELVEVETYFAGNGTTDPTPELENHTANAPATFDDNRLNRRFGHSFQGLPTDITSATLEICLTPLGTLDENDSMGLQYATGTGFDWSRRIGTQGANAGLLPFAWDAEQGQGTETLLLDLSALPTGNGYVDLVDTLNQEGHLDIYVQDDTSVCYVELTIERCICVEHSVEVLQAGKEDAFDRSDGPEPSTPGPELLVWQGSQNSNQTCAHAGALNMFDEPHRNQCFGHTFQNVPNGLRSAELEIRLKGTGCCRTTDSIKFQYEPLNGQFLWSKNLWQLWNNPGTVQISGTWDQDMTFRFDLSDLPSGGGSQGGGSLLAAIQGGRLDVAVADDMAVDYLRLHVEVCIEEEPVTIYGVSSGDGIHAVDVANELVDPEEPGIGGMENLATDETLDVLYTSADRGDLFEHALGQPGVTAVGPAHSGTALGDGHDGYLYLGQPFSPDVYRFQPGGALQFVGADTAGANLGGDLATDPTTGVLYAATTAPATHGLVQVDRATGQQTPVTGSAGLVLDGLAFTCDGRMWGSTGAQLFEIDPATGVATPAFALGFAPTDLSSQAGC